MWTRGRHQQVLILATKSTSARSTFRLVTIHRPPTHRPTDLLTTATTSIQYRRVDFTYCKGSKFENISQYTAQVWPIDELPDDHEDKTVYYKKVETEKR